MFIDIYDWLSSGVLYSSLLYYGSIFIYIEDKNARQATAIYLQRSLKQWLLELNTTPPPFFLWYNRFNEQLFFSPFVFDWAICNVMLTLKASRVCFSQYTHLLNWWLFFFCVAFEHVYLDTSFMRKMAAKIPSDM